MRYSVFFLLLIILAVSTSINAQFSGEGTGTEQNPYVITNVDQLQEMNNDLSAYYELGNDIDASSTVNWNEGEGFRPIGAPNLSNPFKGSLDGKGFTISGLFINHPAWYPVSQSESYAYYVGLFGEIGREGKLSNLGVENADINVSGSIGFVGGIVARNSGILNNVYIKGLVGKRGTDDIGGLVYENFGTIENCYTDLEIIGSGIGGIAYKNNGSIKNSSAKGSIEGKDYPLGGLVATNEGTILGSQFNGTVLGKNSYSKVYHIGGLVGFNIGTGIIDSSFSIGNVSGDYRVGGLVGTNGGTITNSYAEGDVKGDSLNGQFIGGLVGVNGINGIAGYNYTSGTIEDSYAKTNVIGFSSVGGLAGANLWESVISNSHVIGEIKGEATTGGLVGQNIGNEQDGFALIKKSYSIITSGGGSGFVGSNSGFISNSYALGNLINGSGFVGSNDGIISNSYALGNVINGSGFVGINDLEGNISNSFSYLTVNNGSGFASQNDGTIDNSYWGFEKSRQLFGIGTEWGGTSTIKSLNKSEIVMQASFSGWDFSEIWTINDGETLPWLKGVSKDSLISPINIPFSGSGNGTQDDPYLITNIEELQEMQNDIFASYELANDIDASETINWNDGKGFYPVGAFLGIFNGNDFSINELNINRPGMFDVGLFSQTGDSAKVKNLRVTKINIRSDKRYVGGISGINYGLITNSHVQGEISGLQYVGGLVGFNLRSSIITNSSSEISIFGEGNVFGSSNWSITGGLTGFNSGKISESFVLGTVTSNGESTGGLAGSNSGTIENSYSEADVTGTDETGGLIGTLSGNGKIINSYATGSVQGNEFKAGFIGVSTSTDKTLINNYWNINTTGFDEGVGEGDSIGVSGLTNSQMRQQSFFIDWDFIEVWTIREGETFPYLTENPQNPAPGLYINKAPIVNEPLGELTLLEDFESANIAVLDSIFSDADQDTVTYQISKITSNILAVIQQDTLIISSVKDSSGSALVIIRAFDQEELEVFDTLKVQITPVNDLPYQIELPDTLSFSSGEKIVYGYQQNFSDVEDDYTDLIFSVSTAPSEIIANLIEGDSVEVFSPSFTGFGSLKFTVTDTEGGAFETSIVIEVVIATSNELENSTPKEYTLNQNYPNPFNPSSTIMFGIPVEADVKLEIYNLLGQKVKTLLNKKLKAGYHTTQFDASSLSSGMYIYRIQAGDFVQTKKMMLIK